MIRRTLPALLLFVGTNAFAQNVNDATEKAMKEAAAKAAASVVRIETSGGAEAIWGAGRKGPEVMFRRGVGASTGLVVDPNGYIITSTFNFIGKPTDIFVTVPGHPRVVGKVIGHDPTRMLTMLKIEQTGLPVPITFPKKDVRGRHVVDRSRAHARRGPASSAIDQWRDRECGPSCLGQGDPERRQDFTGQLRRTADGY